MAHRLIRSTHLHNWRCCTSPRRLLSPRTSRCLSTSDDPNEVKPSSSPQTFVTPDEEQDNQLDKFAYAIESHPVHDGIISITGWGEGTFKVDKDIVQGSLLLFPTFALTWKNVARIEDVTLDHFAIFKHASPALELIILGTGNRLKRPPPQLYQELTAIAPVEVVDTVNASATFNMLAAEGRNVGAGLVAMGPSN